MLILRRQYHNLLAEPIRLDIHRFTNCCQIMVTKTNRRVDVLQCMVLAVLVIAFLLSTNINKILDRLILIGIGFVLLMAFLYWRSPVYRESIALLDNVSGLELTQHYSLLGIRWKRSQFILSADIIINEAITMHRVIYYLVSIPLSLSSLLLTGNESNKSKSVSTPRVSDINNKLIPLFCNTFPRLDCLKVMYREIQDFKSNSNPKNSKSIFNQKLNDLCINSFSSTNSPLSPTKNGFKTIRQ